MIDVKKYIVLLLLIATAPIKILLSNPQGGTAVSGEFTSQTNGETLLLRTSNRTVINWDDFSIGFGETTEIIQPSLDSAVLNYVTSDTPSSILGNLLSNGTVYLINPNGILIGPSGFVKTGQFIATTLDDGEAKFFENGELQLKGDSDASIVNLGNITATGDIFLVSRKINNQGSIHSTNGVVGLAAGQDVLLKESGDQRIFIRPTGEGEVFSDGSIEALEIEIRSRGNLSSLAINLNGQVQANTVHESGGRIYLKADNGDIGLGSESYDDGNESATFEAIADQGTITIDSPLIFFGTVQLTNGNIIMDPIDNSSTNSTINTDNAALTIDVGDIHYTTGGNVTLSSDKGKSGSIITINEGPTITDPHSTIELTPTGTTTIETGATQNLNGADGKIVTAVGFDVDLSGGESNLNPDSANILQRVSEGSETISLGGTLSADGPSLLINSASTGTGISLSVTGSPFATTASIPTAQISRIVTPTVTPFIYRESTDHVNNSIFGNIKSRKPTAQPRHSPILTQQPRPSLLSKLAQSQGRDSTRLMNLEK